SSDAGGPPGDWAAIAAIRGSSAKNSAAVPPDLYANADVSATARSTSQPAFEPEAGSESKCWPDPTDSDPPTGVLPNGAAPLEPSASPGLEASRSSPITAGAERSRS